MGPASAGGAASLQLVREQRLMTRHVFFYGHEEGVPYGGPWHIFRTDPPGSPYPDHDDLSIALCGVQWDQLAAIGQPRLCEPHCDDCMRQLHEDVIAGRDYSEVLMAELRAEDVARTGVCSRRPRHLQLTRLEY